MPDLADGQLQRNINPKGNNSTRAMPFRTPLNADGSIITHGHEGNLLLEAGQLREEEPISSVWCLCQAHCEATWGDPGQLGENIPEKQLLPLHCCDEAQNCPVFPSLFAFTCTIYLFNLLVHHKKNATGRITALATRGETTPAESYLV